MVEQVRRQQLLNDTVLQMRRANRMLKRPLKVKFIGEEGVDEGGITKEFFQVPDKTGFCAGVQCLVHDRICCSYEQCPSCRCLTFTLSPVQILTDQLLQPDFGMFTVDPDMHILWFRYGLEACIIACAPLQDIEQRVVSLLGTSQSSTIGQGISAAGLAGGVQAGWQPCGEMMWSCRVCVLYVSSVSSTG